MTTESTMNCTPVRGENEEPLQFEIARKGQELMALLDQVLPENDEMVSGGVLAYLRIVLPAVVRNMNSGVYNDLGLVPPVHNPAYLPPPGMDTVIETLRQEALRTADETTDREVQQYNEGVRWAFAKVRNAFESHRQGFPLDANGERVSEMTSTPSVTATTPKEERTLKVPQGYRAILVPAGVVADKPDYDACAEAATKATGMPSLRNDTWLSIFIREINTWCYQRAVPEPTINDTGTKTGRTSSVHPSKSNTPKSKGSKK